jgi:hypothetical protein
MIVSLNSRTRARESPSGTVRLGDRGGVGLVLAVARSRPGFRFGHYQNEWVNKLVVDEDHLLAYLDSRANKGWTFALGDRIDVARRRHGVDKSSAAARLIQRAAAG